MRLGYARVSATDPRLEQQRAKLKAQDCDVIYEEHHVELIDVQSTLEKQLLPALRRDDVLVVTSLDRIGLRISRLLQTLVSLHCRGIRLIALAESLDSAISAWPVLITVAQQVAHTERVLHQESSRRGVLRAMARGRAPGRPVKMSRSALGDARRLLEEGRAPAEVATFLNVSIATLYRHVPAAASL